MTYLSIEAVEAKLRALIDPEHTLSEAAWSYLMWQRSNIHYGIGYSGSIDELFANFGASVWREAFDAERHAKKFAEELGVPDELLGKLTDADLHAIRSVMEDRWASDSLVIVGLALDVLETPVGGRT